MSLRPPSTSPSPSPGPHNSGGGVRASLQPQPRTNAGASLAPISVRPNMTPGGRPTSELLGGAAGAQIVFQTPEAEAIDQWFENLQNYEATLEEMAAASLDVNFKEELSAIEQWFRVLSEAERTAALYSLLQHSTQVQIRFFITVLQQMARSDPMTALLSPAVGSSMQSQMEAKLQQMGLKSPGLPSSGSGIPREPQSPSLRSFSAGNAANRQSLSSIDPPNYLSPDSAANLNNAGNAGGDAAATLAQQRARLKANAAHRISAPGLMAEAGRPNSLWASSSLSQVAERAPSPSANSTGSTNDLTLSPGPAPSSIRPKSTDFTGVANQFMKSPRPTSTANSNNSNAADSDGIDIQISDLRLNEQLSPMVGGNWASMVNTPLVPMFGDGSAVGNPPSNALDAASMKLSAWNNNPSGRSVVLDDAKKFRRNSKGAGAAVNGSPSSLGVKKNGMGDEGLGIHKSNAFQNNTGGLGGGQGWGGGVARSPALSAVSSTRFNGSEDALSSYGGGANTSGTMSPGMPGMGMGGFNMFNGMGGMGGMGGMNMMGGMGGMGGMNGMNGMGLGGMGMNPNTLEGQLFAAQLAAVSGGFSPGLAASMGFGQGVAGQPGGPAAGPNHGNRSMRGGNNPRMVNNLNNGKSAPGSVRESATKDKPEDEVDPALLNDIPAWLRSLRLHKYTPNFEGMSWKDMILMDEAQLEANGVAALGARRKMLKTFETVRNKMGIDMPGSTADSPAAVSPDQ